MRMWRLIIILLLGSRTIFAQTLDLPARPSGSVGGTEFALSITNFDRPEREEKIVHEIARGNVPDFLRKLSPIHVESVHDGKTNSAVYYVTPDYLAVGSDDDYFLTPLSPIFAQRVADLTHCSLPTRKMVDDIFAAAVVKLVPRNIPPSPAMSTVPVFIQHYAIIRTQRNEQLAAHPLGALVAGHEKDVVLSNKLPDSGAKVAIYGWHKPDGKPIQPLYAGHADYYADYSHGIRLVQSSMTVNGSPTTLPEVLANPALADLLSDEGVMLRTRYPTNYFPRPAPKNTTAVTTNAPSPN